MLKARVTRLQAIVRQRRHRRAFLQLRRAVLVLQSKRRQRAAIAIRSNRQRALARLQHVMKAWSARCRFLSTRRRAIALQRLITSWLRCRTFRRLRRAAVRVQRAWRRHHRGRHWREELALLFRASLHHGGGATHGRMMEDSDRRLERLRRDPELFFALRPAMFGFNSLFHHAAASGDFHVVQFMLRQSPHKGVLPPAELLAARNGAGRTAFHEAVLHAQYEMAKLLLHEATQLERTTCPDNKKKTETMKAEKEEEPQQELDGGTPRVVYQGFLKKRRETSRWMKRFVVLSVDAQGVAALTYFANDRPATLARSDLAKRIELRHALFKKSIDVPFAFEVHSPLLLAGRNKEGRLYFAAASELESQTWLAHLRDTVPSDVEARVFAMHRAHKYGSLQFRGSRDAQDALQSRDLRPVERDAAASRGARGRRRPRERRAVAARGQQLVRDRGLRSRRRRSRSRFETKTTTTTTIIIIIIITRPSAPTWTYRHRHRHRRRCRCLSEQVARRDGGGRSQDSAVADRERRRAQRAECCGPLAAQARAAGAQLPRREASAGPRRARDRTQRRRDRGRAAHQGGARQDRDLERQQRVARRTYVVRAIARVVTRAHELVPQEVECQRQRQRQLVHYVVVCGRRG
ncbi:hypothetical protein PINS_up004448 [Pythium insidiosum]|nr:hypothetical protein PINS_up004448 [Pythium insidiosum]